jgi:hypothetical protein
MSPPFAPEGLRQLLATFGQLLASPAVRDALSKSDRSLLAHGDRTLAEWNRAFKREPADDVAQHPGGYAPLVREG